MAAHAGRTCADSGVPGGRSAPPVDCATLGRVPTLVAPSLSDGEIGVRAIVPGDIPAIVAACADPEIPRWTRVPSPYTREDAERFLAIAATEAAAGEGLALAICDVADDRLIGTIGLMEVDRRRGYAEIGYWAAAAARGRGATTRAVVLVRDWAGAELELAEIEILCPLRQPPVAAGGRARRLHRHRRDARGAGGCRPAAATATRSTSGARRRGRPHAVRRSALTCGAATRCSTAHRCWSCCCRARSSGSSCASARRSCWPRPARSRSSPRASPTQRSTPCRRRSRTRSPGARRSGCGYPARRPRSPCSRPRRRRSRSRSSNAIRAPSCGSSARDPVPALDSAFVLDVGAASDLRGVWLRVESLGIASGRLGSERGL